jgi:hypothetical protein
MIDIKHGKRIVTKSYYDGQVVSEHEELEVSLYSSRESILKDVIDSMLVISKGETHKLELEICIDKLGRYRLIKRWRIE